MGREALFAALSWLSVSGTLAVNSFVLKDQQGVASSPRLYRQATVGAVYASAAPYGAYSFQIPTYSAPSAAASRVIPVKETFSLQNANGYLKDSYGNRFVEALQSMKSLPFKPFPQQYVQLQELPAHFAQPLSAGVPYRLPAAPTTLNHQFGFAQPSVYADSYKNLMPVSFSYGPQFGSVIHEPVQSAAPLRNSHINSPSAQGVSHSVSENQERPSVQQQPTSHKAVYADTQQRERYHQPQGFHRNGPSIQEFSHVSENQQYPTTPQQLTSHKAVYASNEPQAKYHHLKGEQKFQRLQEAAQETSEEDPTPAPEVRQKVTTKQIVSATKQTPIPTVVNGKKTVVNVKTKPPLPLLDIHLLEPLTFANPLVPQVQHFLPRINEATYHKLPELEKHSDKTYQKEYVVQKTKTYDSGLVQGKPKKPKKKQKLPEVEHVYHDEYIPAATAKPTVTVNEAPEISYEINSPNHKETYKEQVVKYNKETNSEPVHYTYGTNTHKEPVHYSYTHSSKEPVHIQEIRYEGKGEAPKQLIYNFKPEGHNREDEKSKTESEDSNEHSERNGSHRSHNRGHKEHQSPRQEAPKSSHHYIPEHREQEYHHTPNPDTHRNVQHREPEYHHSPHSDTHHKVQHREQEYHHSPHSDTHHKVQHREQEYHHNPHSDTHHNVQHIEQKYHHNPHSDTHHNVQHKVHSSQHEPAQYHSLEEIPFQPVAQYEEDISHTAPIKVDPNQHVQPTQAEPPNQPRPSPASQHQSNPHHETPSTHVHEKTKQVYIKEETPEDDDTIGEQLPQSMFGKEEDKEEDFEKAYQNSAFGFPAYGKSSVDVEKDIYNPESYGVPRDHSTYDINHSPFQQYQAHGDDFPKEMRLSYRDERDKMKEDYFLDYSVSKPESLVDRYKNKVNYYKLYKNQKPEKYVLHEEDGENQQKQNAKLTAIPYSYYPVRGDNMKQFFAQYKATPVLFEYDYSKAAPTTKDNSAHASRPFLRYKMNTHFVEPQFQYGFEPIAIPRLLDSELAAMATNNSPESEKPGTRKKIYKENFYIRKTSMSDAEPNS